MEGITEEQLKEIIQLDYSMANGVTKSLKYLVTADKPGAKRIEQATEFGVEIISWDKFVEIVGLKNMVADLQAKYEAEKEVKKSK